MQLRCTYCQTMFALSRDEMLAALEHMSEHRLIYYDAHCPKCRRANRVEKARLERFFPDWQQRLEAMAKEASAQAEGASQETPPAAEAASSSPKKKAPVAAAPEKKSPASRAKSSSKAGPAASASPKVKKPAPATTASGKKSAETKKK